MVASRGRLELNCTLGRYTYYNIKIKFQWLQDTDYLGMGLENGYLKLVWSFRHENASGRDIDGEVISPSQKLSNTRFLSRVVPLSGYLADAEWHLVVLRLEKSNITMTVDQVLAYIEEPGLTTELDYDSVKLCIGKFL